MEPSIFFLSSARPMNNYCGMYVNHQRLLIGETQNIKGMDESVEENNMMSLNKKLQSLQEDKKREMESEDDDKLDAKEDDKVEDNRRNTESNIEM